MLVSADDQVVQDTYIQQLSGLNDSTRHGDIIGAGGGIAAGMVVNDINSIEKTLLYSTKDTQYNRQSSPKRISS
jgi:hypothetical protein